MKILSRPARPWWLFLGVLLLAGSTLGANWALNGSLLANISLPGERAAPKKSNTMPVAALGFVDVEGGVAALHPIQAGRVVEVASEGATASKGGVLLQLDDRLAQYQLEEARAAVSAAREQMHKAQNAAAQHKNLIDQQDVAISVAQFSKGVVDQELAKVSEIYQASGGTVFDKNMLAEKQKIAQQNIEAEKLKRTALMLAAKTLEIEINRAQADIDAKIAQQKKAELAVEECKLRAPFNGVVLRVMVSPGEVLTNSATQAALTFCPAKPLIVRAEVLQEWANKVAVGHSVIIKDDAVKSAEWTGKVASISNWIAPKRQRIIEPFMMNDVRTLECIIKLDPPAPVRIGQRVRVQIKVDG